MKLRTFSDILEIRSGRNQKDVLNPNGKYPILGSAGKVMGYSDKFICEENTTIIGRKGTINNPMLIREKFWNVDTAFGLHALNELDKKYLFYFCQSFDFTKLDKGSGRPSLVKSDLLKIKMYCPEIDEQKQIVKILDTAFETIEKAKTNLEKNLKNTKELFDSKLNEIFSQKGEGWEEKTLGEVCIYEKTKNIKKLPYIGLEDIVSNKGVFIGSYENHEVKSTTFYFTSDHLLYGRLRPYLNKVFMPDFEGHCSTEIFPIRVKNIVVREFLFYWFISSNVVQRINATCTGARMPRANMNEVLKFKLFIPNITIQKSIIIEIIKLDKQTKQLEQKYQQKLNNLEELKKSLLQKAFSGELTK